MSGQETGHHVEQPLSTETHTPEAPLQNLLNRKSTRRGFVGGLATLTSTGAVGRRGRVTAAETKNSEPGNQKSLTPNEQAFAEVVESDLDRLMSFAQNAPLYEHSEGFPARSAGIQIPGDQFYRFIDGLTVVSGVSEVFERAAGENKAASMMVVGIPVDVYRVPYLVYGPDNPYNPDDPTHLDDPDWHEKHGEAFANFVKMRGIVGNKTQGNIPPILEWDTFLGLTTDQNAPEPVTYMQWHKIIDPSDERLTLQSPAQIKSFRESGFTLTPQQDFIDILSRRLNGSTFMAMLTGVSGVLTSEDISSAQGLNHIVNYGIPQNGTTTSENIAPRLHAMQKLNVVEAAIIDATMGYNIDSSNAYTHDPSDLFTDTYPYEDPSILAKKINNQPDLREREFVSSADLSGTFWGGAPIFFDQKTHLYEPQQVAST